ncbi:MAG: dTDP-4-dehydrorhamnose 3,5-epimerase [Victivallales bacterium]|jgi:dTDP-4-dehydrorhamnose 3,5-epimerase|nr:dTDP-4-dehydrorhamnose 3,5-epimerase [Victivallales bacterium]
MKVFETAIAGVKILEPKLFGDARGYFFESWNQAKFAEVGINVDFVQDNESFSTYGVLRGLHYQMPPYTQAKLVRVIDGIVLDVVVDIRKNSPTFGKSVSVELSGENKRQLFAPRGMAHGFAVLSPTATFAYKCDNIYAPSHERSIRFDDPELDIDWRISPKDYLLSKKDHEGVPFKKAEYLSEEGV